MKVLLIWASSFTGYWIAQALHSAGSHVVGLFAMIDQFPKGPVANGSLGMSNYARHPNAFCAPSDVKPDCKDFSNDLEIFRVECDSYAREGDTVRAERDAFASELAALKTKYDELSRTYENLANESDALNTERCNLLRVQERLILRIKKIAFFYERLRKSRTWPFLKFTMAIRRRIDGMGRVASGELGSFSRPFSEDAPNEHASAVPVAWVSAHEAKGLLNLVWYGHDPVPMHARFYQGGALPVKPSIKTGNYWHSRIIKKGDRSRARKVRISKLVLRFKALLPDRVVERMKRRIVKNTFLEEIDNATMTLHWSAINFINFEMIEQRLLMRVPSNKPSSNSPTFSIVTSFYGDLSSFRQCANSVAKISVDWNEPSIEWIINNNDIELPNEELLSVIPEWVRSGTKITSGDKNLGVTSGLNEAISRTTNEWILFLDADVLLEPEVNDVLKNYIIVYNRSRYISSGLIDLDERSNVLRYRGHLRRSSEIYSAERIAWHLKAVRKDLFDEIGLLNPTYNLSQDCDFALKVAEKEPILLIPEYLYRYRWHAKTLSVSQRRRQDHAYQSIVGDSVPRLFTRKNSVSPESVKIDNRLLRTHVRRGATVVRTRGVRPELFVETLVSIEGQDFPVEPIVAVHGDSNSFESVQELCLKIGSKAVVLHAHQPSRLRGYPCNVGLDYISAHAAEFDFISFLDDDDIHYPNFGERMAIALELTGADVVYAEANRREPWAEHTVGPGLLPAACLVKGNFITNNSFVLRTNAFIRSRARFNEKMEYLEDWDFLITLLTSGLNFVPLFETATEFRIFSDGSTVKKRFPELFSICQEHCLKRGVEAARRLGLAWFYTSLFDFNLDLRQPLTPNEEQHILAARKIFETEWIAHAFDNETVHE